MADPALRFLEYVFLALLYLFFLRVVRAVWVELREPRAGTGGAQPGDRLPPHASSNGAPKGRGVPHELTVVSPEDAKGQAFALADELTIGRSPRCSVPLADRRLRVAGPCPAVPQGGRVLGRGPGVHKRHPDERAQAGRRCPAAERGPDPGGPNRPGAAEVTKLVVGSATDVGLVRSNNQDQLLVTPGLYAVADGMGGHAAGEVASSTAVSALGRRLRSHRRAHRSFPGERGQGGKPRGLGASQDQPGMFGMGTTLVALAVVEREDGTNGLAVAHIGDSRLYAYRDGTLKQVTVDHSLVQELVDEGQISEAQAAVHPQRHVLTRALGVEPDIEVDIIDLAPRHGDRYLLCSDGLPREVSDDQIADCPGHGSPTRRGCQRARRVANLERRATTT